MKALLINVANVKWVNEVRIRVKYFATACVIITENYRMYARTNDKITTRKGENGADQNNHNRVFK